MLNLDSFEKNHQNNMVSKFFKIAVIQNDFDQL